MVEWNQEVPTESSIVLPPDPRVLDSIGRNHSLETALADLVDNAVDAQATRVVIRFIRSQQGLVAVYVLDNGRGMTAETLNTAMTIGGKREYSGNDLGHFGLGLKAASFSQAKSLTVMSRAAGQQPVGRRWRPDIVSRSDFRCDVVTSSFVAEEFDKDWPFDSANSGTLIRWDDVSAFPVTTDTVQIETYLDRTITLTCQHLGLTFHRFLAGGRLRIDVEVLNVENALLGTKVPVDALDPFGYPRSGLDDYPKTLVAEMDGHRVEFRCHLWPKPSNLPQYRLLDRSDDHQGLYFYRRDRLLQSGGWDGVHALDRRLKLARVEVDIDGDMGGLFQMNPEKSRVQTGPEFARLAATARAHDGTTLRGYLEVAEGLFRKSQARVSKRTAMIHPGQGLPPRVRTIIQNEIPAVRGEDLIAIRWDDFIDDAFFRIDRDTQTLWLNKRYRKMLLGGKHGGLNDVPLVKSLLYLLVANVFEGEYLGKKDKDNIEMWQSILTAAARAERQ
ncbi:ATP-binding protein [Nocardia panacis]|uniref:ATP-binding protein n=1 Tax=Nocardia panacis TaxID=2340916 RepID=A0A3A4KAZ0_9NOCA|nr:ATP-binding protein [Nocardia panacis]RJO78868.1 ATP-binding protein [Nocardia panacis]